MNFYIYCRSGFLFLACGAQLLQEANNSRECQFLQCTSSLNVNSIGRWRTAFSFFLCKILRQTRVFLTHLIYFYVTARSCPNHLLYLWHLSRMLKFMSIFLYVSNAKIWIGCLLFHKTFQNSPINDAVTGLLEAIP